MKVKNIFVELLVDNMLDTLEWYRKYLTFEISFLDDKQNPTFAEIGINGFKIKMYQRKEFETEIEKFKSMKKGGTFVIFIETDNIEQLYKQFYGKVSVIQELFTTNYGTKQFSIEDPNGYILMFSASTP